MPFKDDSDQPVWHAGRMVSSADFTEQQINESVSGMVNVWAPLVPTDKHNGCIRLVPGSHKWDVLSLQPRRGQRSYHANKDSEGYLEVDTELMKTHEHRVVDIELNPGDVLLFKQKLIHSGNPNKTDGIRWSIDWRYQNAELHTLRNHEGHLARSAKNARSVVRGHSRWWERIPRERLKSQQQPVSSGAMMGLSDVAYSRLQTEGYIVLPGLIPPHLIQGAVRDCEQLADVLIEEMVAAGAPDRMAHEDFEHRLARVQQHSDSIRDIDISELKKPGLGELYMFPELLDIVETVLGGSEIRLYPDYSVSTKTPNKGRDHDLSNWHAGRMTVNDLQQELQSAEIKAVLDSMVNVWAPLVPVTRENGCVRVIPGSHKLDVMSLLPPPGSSAFAAQQQTGYLVVDPDLMANFECTAVDIELKPGDVMLFKQQLVHSGRPNLSEGVRWSLDWRYQDARFPTLLPIEGSLMRSEEFPTDVVRSPQDWVASKFAPPPPHRSKAMPIKIPKIPLPPGSTTSPAAALTTVAFSRADARKLEAQGFLVLKRLLPADVLKAAVKACEGIVSNIADELVRAGKIADPMIDQPFESRFAELQRRCPEDVPRIFRQELHTEGMGKLFFCPKLLDVIEHALGSNEVRLYPNYAGKRQAILCIPVQEGMTRPSHWVKVRLEPTVQPFHGGSRLACRSCEADGTFQPCYSSNPKRDYNTLATLPRTRPSIAIASFRPLLPPPCPPPSLPPLCSVPEVAVQGGRRDDRSCGVACRPHGEICRLYGAADQGQCIWDGECVGPAGAHH
jgi:ectoine hydroxylase-related dioxygenase (phytanoyl-CoA dioxygenase family)